MFHYKDQISLVLESGSGGNGCLSFFRTKTNPRGGPDGGDGAQGGSLILRSSTKVNGFEQLKKKPKYRAGAGSSGARQLKAGRKGLDFHLDIPIGTLVRNRKGQILNDFVVAQKEIFLVGGRGGRGNAFFKTSLNQAPRRFQKGEKGLVEKVILELKPVVQVALIGKVNAGKSSFFNLVTKAQSPVASYPYTTLSPYIGKLKQSLESYFILDIPGLDLGAAKNIFKGLSFLRSIQRAEILLHCLDSGSENLFKDKEEIDEELKKFDEKYEESYFQKLSEKKTFFILTKTDTLNNSSALNQIIKKIKVKKNQKIFLLSNKTKQGLDEILSAICKELENSNNESLSRKAW